MKYNQSHLDLKFPIKICAWEQSHTLLYEYAHHKISRVRTSTNTE